MLSDGLVTAHQCGSRVRTALLCALCLHESLLPYAECGPDGVPASPNNTCHSIHMHTAQCNSLWFPAEQQSKGSSVKAPRPQPGGGAWLPVISGLVCSVSWKTYFPIHSSSPPNWVCALWWLEGSLLESTSSSILPPSSTFPGALHVLM